MLPNAWVDPRYDVSMGGEVDTCTRGLYAFHSTTRSTPPLPCRVSPISFEHVPIIEVEVIFGQSSGLSLSPRVTGEVALACA